MPVDRRWLLHPQLTWLDNGMMDYVARLVSQLASWEGHHEVHDITVSTYDSAWIHMERYGNRFGLVVFDEVHHLPGPSFSAAAMARIAPFPGWVSLQP